MRRSFTFVFLACGALALLAAGPALGDLPRTVLGSNGEVYTVRSGSYGALFGGDAPAGAGANPVLALEVLKAGKVDRTLVPGTGGPEDEQDATLAFDTVGSRPYVIWQSQRVFSIVGFSGADGWQQPVELPGDPASSKRNPQLATSVVRYQKLDSEGNRVAASRTMVHLVYHLDDGDVDGRLIYTAAAIEDGIVVPSTRAFDLRLLAGNAPAAANASTAPASLRQRPVAQRGRDSNNVGIAFVDDRRGELVTLELRPIADDLLYFADKVRAVVIETGVDNPGATIAVLIEKVRAVIIETGCNVMHPVVANFLSKSFLDALAATDPALTLEAAVTSAWAQVIATGITLQQGSSATPHVVELAAAAGDGSSRALDLRWVSRRGLPQLPEGDVKLFLSPRAQEASIAWSVPTAVRYRESKGGGWDSLRSLQLGPTLTREQAFKLVEQRLDEQ